MAHHNQNVSLDLIKRGIEAYTEMGQFGDSVVRVDRHWDPEVPGAFAVRAELKMGGYLFFLVDAHARPLVTPEDVAEELEEADFGQWPPRQGRPRFF